MRLFRRLFSTTLLGATLLWMGCGDSTTPGAPPPANKCGSCARYETCMSSGFCGVNPNSTWMFTVGSATIATMKTDGSTWDTLGGAPDPFVQIDTKKSTTKQDTFSPTWQEGAVYTATTLLNQGVQVTVYDEDIAANDLIGGPVTVRPTETDLRTGSLTVKNIGQVQSINFSLVAQ